MNKVLYAICVLGIGSLAAGYSATAGPAPAFLSARPVWPEGRTTERNLLVEFRASFERPGAGPVLVRLTGSTVYRLLVNGQFAGYGPARAGRGVFRVAEWNIAPKLKAGRNEVAVEVAGYNVNSYYLLDQPSFLRAEIVAGGKVIAATGREGFAAMIRHDRVQKTQRYSFQRPFSEVWRLPGRPAEPARCAVVETKTLAPRRVPYPTFDLVRPVAHVAAGRVRKGPMPEKVWKDRSLTGIGPLLGGFPESELATIPSIELQAVKTVSSGPAPKTIELNADSFHTLDFGVDLTGFIGAKIIVLKKTRLFMTFDEILSRGDVDWKRLGCVNIVTYELDPGTYNVESFEPYTLRYLKLIVLEGKVARSASGFAYSRR